MRIGILETGFPPRELQEAHGTYPDMFAKLLGGHGFEFQAWPVLKDVFPQGPHDADGWLITGSRFGVYDDEPWIAINPSIQRRSREMVAGWETYMALGARLCG